MFYNLPSNIIQLIFQYLDIKDCLLLMSSHDNCSNKMICKYLYTRMNTITVEVKGVTDNGRTYPYVSESICKFKVDELVKAIIKLLDKQCITYLHNPDNIKYKYPREHLPITNVHPIVEKYWNRGDILYGSHIKTGVVNDNVILLTKEHIKKISKIIIENEQCEKKFSYEHVYQYPIHWFYADFGIKYENNTKYDLLEIQIEKICCVDKI